MWTADGASLDEKYRLINLAELEEATKAVDMRAAWSEEGLVFAVRVSGKHQPPWCRASRLDDSDGLHIWIDTRDVHNVHRAGRFCRQFVFLPAGTGPKLNEPVADWLPINRSREQPHPLAPGQLKVHSEVHDDGYLIEAFIPADALTGFDPSEHPRLGFTYAIQDRELGEQTFGVGSPLPYQEDPSLWATLDLTKQ